MSGEFTAPSVRFNVYKGVEEADGIHRPMPAKQPFSLGEQTFHDLIGRIDPQAAAVQWACRSLPLPKNCAFDRSSWALFVEAAPGMWITFDDLPEDLADALLDKNFYELMTRPIQRPFNMERLAALIEKIKVLDPATAVCDWTYADFNDPYGMGDVPCIQVGREYFVQTPSGPWAWFDDVPEDIRRALCNAHGRKLAFPAGLEGLATDSRSTQPEPDHVVPF